MIKVCKQCGKEFKADGNKRLYCSRGCQWASLKKQRPTAICGYCGKEFTIKRVDVPGKFCSHQCQIDLLHQERLERLEARQIQYKKKQEELAKERARLRAEKKRLEKIQNDAKRTRNCAECGELFISRHGAKFCSDKCRRRADNRRRDKRLKKCDVVDHSISLIGVYHRYGGVCQGCGQLLTFDHDPNDDMYPSIDHKIPIIKGGNHTWDNVQLMCRRCNYIKKDNLTV